MSFNYCPSCGTARASASARYCATCAEPLRAGDASTRQRRRPPATGRILIAVLGVCIGGAVFCLVLIVLASGLLESRSAGPSATVRNYLEKDLYSSRERGEANLMMEVVPAYFDPVSCTVPGRSFSEAFSPGLLEGAPVFSRRVELSFAVLEDALTVDTLVERGREAIVSIETGQATYQQRMIEISDGEREAWFFACS